MYVLSGFCNFLHAAFVLAWVLDFCMYQETVMIIRDAA